MSRVFDRVRSFVHEVAGRTPPRISSSSGTPIELPGMTGFLLPGKPDSASDQAPGSALSRIPTAFSMARAFGTRYISDVELDFIVKREPVIHWVVWYVAQDIFDNGFRAYTLSDPLDEDFNLAVQSVFLKLKVWQALKRSTAFERLYGTSIIVCAYNNGGEWDTSIYEGDNSTLKPGLKLEQFTPYPWSQVAVDTLDDDESSLRYGLPVLYNITRSDGTIFEVHWSKVVHDAPRLFDHPYEGLSVVEILYDDATGFRNMRWGLYQTIFRYGSGFPHIHLPWANRNQIRALIDGGEFDYINSRGLFVTGGRGEDKETIDFKGVQNVTLNPDPYIKVAFESFSLGSRIPQDIFKGASAGRMTGSEFNERNYYKYISAEQSTKDSVVREVIDRLIATGQIELADARKRLGTDTEYVFEWASAYVLNEVDQTRIYLWESTAYKNYTEVMTVDEIRALKELDPLPDGEGEVVLGIERIKAQKARTEFNPSQERKGQTQPKEEETQGNRPEER